MAQPSQHPLPPLPEGFRASGVLLHITSLPSPYGIGDCGPAAMAWVDALAAAGQTWWQMLPLGPTGCGNSPYQSTSTFAGNEALISPDLLIEDGLLAKEDCQHGGFAKHEADYESALPFKFMLLDIAWANFQRGEAAVLGQELAQFEQQQAHWLEDYALYMALRDQSGGAPYFEWPERLVKRDPAALLASRQELATEIAKYRFRQFLFFRRWAALKQHARRSGLKLVGDLPIFVSADSADVWAHPQLYLLDERFQPSVVAGVPPDYFSPTGQHWGNPLYNWDAMKASGYRWWLERLRASLELVDLIRLDHFRGFEAAWHVPAGEMTAENGQWVPGPGADFLLAVRDALGGLPLIAEDLGHITDEVRALRDDFELPGMRVLQFAFDGTADNAFLPHMYVTNTVVYSGTHDNDTSRGWYENLSEERQRQLWNYMDRPAGTSEEASWELIRLAQESRAAAAVFPVQDLLNLGSEARMNVPGVADGNWRWRMTPDMPIATALKRLRELTAKTGRLRPA